MTEDGQQPTVYLDTNVFIRAVEGTGETAVGPRRLIDILRRRTGIAFTSEITLAEVLAPPQRTDAMPLHLKRRAYLDILLWSGFIVLTPVSRDILIETATFRAKARMRLPDAIHLVTAIRGGCRYLVSADKGDFKSMPPGMSRVEPDEAGIEELLRALA